MSKSPVLVSSSLAAAVFTPLVGKEVDGVGEVSVDSSVTHTARIKRAVRVVWFALRNSIALGWLRRVQVIEKSLPERTWNGAHGRRHAASIVIR